MISVQTFLQGIQTSLTNHAKKKYVRIGGFDCIATAIMPKITAISKAAFLSTPLEKNFPQAGTHVSITNERAVHNPTQQANASTLPADMK